MSPPPFHQSTCSALFARCSTTDEVYEVLTAYVFSKFSHGTSTWAVFMKIYYLKLYLNGTRQASILLNHYAAFREIEQDIVNGAGQGLGDRPVQSDVGREAWNIARAGIKQPKNKKWGWKGRRTVQPGAGGRGPGGPGGGPAATLRRRSEAEVRADGEAFADILRARRMAGVDECGRVTTPEAFEILTAYVFAKYSAGNQLWHVVKKLYYLRLFMSTNPVGRRVLQDHYEAFRDIEEYIVSGIEGIGDKPIKTVLGREAWNIARSRLNRTTIWPWGKKAVGDIAWDGPGSVASGPARRTYDEVERDGAIFEEILRARRMAGTDGLGVRRPPGYVEPPREPAARSPSFDDHQLTRGISLGSDHGVAPPVTLAQVRRNLALTASDTWVSGTQIQALLELDYPHLSVFNKSAFPPSFAAGVPTGTNSIIDSWYAKRPAGAVQMAVVSGGAAGDPASLGVGWVLASLSESSATTKAAYATVVKQEVGYLLGLPRASTGGAISQRPASEPVQLWADYVYMVPPFLAYQGVVSGNTSLISEAYNQCLSYRAKLYNSNYGLWEHVVLGSWQDIGIWGTGNAWAAAGMARVLATIQHSSYASQFTLQQANLVSWINEILTNAFSHASSDNLLPNYYEIATSGTFYDSSSSALLAATALRMQILGHGVAANTAKALLIRNAVNAKVSSTGWLQNVVDPLSWTVQTNQSPEGEAFVLLLQAAYTDYLASL
ncbi:Glycosyl hydrolase, family 88 [Pseudohyphozyma bogoriensis]|nr:Glycosyl hydrolase, family 88 [Pseudohyphozyma bogoriensis]